MMLGNERRVSMSIAVVSGFSADIIIAIYGAVLCLPPLSRAVSPSARGCHLQQAAVLGNGTRWKTHSIHFTDSVGFQIPAFHMCSTSSLLYPLQPLLT